MDFLKAEIAKKRKAEEASQLGSSAAAAEKDDDKGEGSSSASSPPPSKYIRRGDLQRQKQQEAEREAEARRVEKERLKRLKEEERNRRTVSYLQKRSLAIYRSPHSPAHHPNPVQINDTRSIFEALEIRPSRRLRSSNSTRSHCRCSQRELQHLSLGSS